jgi:hypothetical protein
LVSKRTTLLLLFLSACLFFWPAFAASEAPAGWETVFDFLVQDVCTGAQGQVLPGVSPVDAACTRRRDIRTGERLPYHKHDWASQAERQHLPLGWQRSDSFPVMAGAYGLAVAQIWDFGDGSRGFGHFDEGDGGQIAFFSKNSVAFGVTEDGGAGLQFFIGPDCDLLDAWIVADRTFAPDRPGQTLAWLTRRSYMCPVWMNDAYTRWHIQPLTFDVKSQGREARKSFDTLVSEHFGGRDAESAEHLERMYFTRELGLTRWERWQNLGVKESAGDREKAAYMAQSGRCENFNNAPGPAKAASSNPRRGSAGNWAMVDCRQWTNIAPPRERLGDLPDFWVADLLKRPEASRLLSR